MSLRSRFFARAWMLIPLGAFGFLVWCGGQRMQRVEAVANTDREEAVLDPHSPTGYAGGKRWLIVPEHNNRSYQWIAETQQMLARGEWRVRRVDYENAPFGREVHAASPYHWWLALVGWCDRAVSGRSAGLAVEHAALWAEPLLHGLLLLGTTLFAARQFGALAASLLAFGLVAIFPLGASFLPGVPDDHSLGRICAFWSVLPLLAAVAGVNRAADGEVRARRLFGFAGIAGGLGLWISAAGQTPVLAGIVLGGLLAAGINAIGAGRKETAVSGASRWRCWALGGGTTCLAAYLVEYFPAHLDFRLAVNHPLYGLAWVGAGEALALFERRDQAGWDWWRRIRLVLALTAIAALPVALKLGDGPGLLAGDLAASRLDYLPDGVVARNLAAWVARDGLSAGVVATCLPLLLLAPAVWLLGRRASTPGSRTAMALVLGPVTVSLLLACFQLEWWHVADAMLLALLAAVAASLPANPGGSTARWLLTGLVGLVFLPGVVRLWPLPASAGNLEFTRLEAEGLLERSLAHWVADHAGPDGAVILAPPDRTPSYCFHGGLRGLGTANWENREGLAATIRIASATTADEALALLNQRSVTHIILPSWDADLDEFARWTLGKPEDAFVTAMHHWALPPWLRPLPYRLPAVAGFEGQSVAILQVTDEDSRAAATGRLAEYFLESQLPELAAAAVPALQRYPADLGALVALAQVEQARGDPDAYAKVFAALVANLAGGSDRTLAWDRRVSLAIVLAQGGRNDLAREQTHRCLEKIDEARLRTLTTASLFRLLTLAKAFDLPLADPALRLRAGQLLPAELRRRL